MKKSYTARMEEGLRGLGEWHLFSLEMFPEGIAASRQSLSLEEDVVGVRHTILGTLILDTLDCGLCQNEAGGQATLYDSYVAKPA